MTTLAVSPGGDSNPHTISAEDIHKLLVRTHKLGSKLRLRFLRALLTFDRMRLYVPLGFSGTVQYAERYFGHQKSQTYDTLKIAEALESLPATTCAFEEGTLSWSALRQVTRIASAETENEWLEFASARNLHALRAEVKDAVAKNRKTPRQNSYGLPHMTTRVTFELEPEDHALVEKLLEKVGKEMAEALQVDSVKPHQALVYLARRILESGTEAATGNGNSDNKPLDTVIYRKCPDCRVSHVATQNGFMEVSPEVVERIEGDARKVNISPEEEISPDAEIPPEDGAAAKDRPNTPALTRRVYLRDAGACANPCCGCKGRFHAHHITFRSQGGPSALCNEVLLCDRCHALVHQGLLKIEGDPAGDLRWKTASEDIDRALAEETEEVLSVPVLIPPQVPVPGPGAGPDSTVWNFHTVENTNGTRTSEQEEEVLWAVAALEKLGHPKKAAQARAERAWDLLIQEMTGKEAGETPRTPDATAITNRALRVGR